MSISFQFPTWQEGQVCTVLTPMPTIDELDQLEEKTMVSVNPDEDRMKIWISWR